ncbi:MAG: hypothetical protein D6719_13825 [Candidatus Dadabacteria bacterium]|nr:MAG: hypothetical protein D6719_13825 [Candidatus Dadabacteria bacterium]
MKRELKKIFLQTAPAEQGVTLMEMIVGLLISATLMLSVIDFFTNSTHIALDNDVTMKAEEKARAILDLMVFDLRMIGSGMPLLQPDFDYNDTTLGDAPFAVLSDSDSDTLKFRINESGHSTVLTADFTPSSSNKTFTVLSTDDLYVGDKVYISDALVGGSDGLYGEITSISGNDITLKSDYVASDSASFPAGSEVNRVVTVTYQSPSGSSGITRDSGAGAVSLGPNTWFSVKYYDASGNSMTPPLSDSQRAEDLLTVEVTVTASGDRLLSDGTTYTAQAKQKVVIRNFKVG